MRRVVKNEATGAPDEVILPPLDETWTKIGPPLRRSLWSRIRRDPDGAIIGFELRRGREGDDGYIDIPVASLALEAVAKFIAYADAYADERDPDCFAAVDLVREDRAGAPQFSWSTPTHALALARVTALLVRFPTADVAQSGRGYTVTVPPDDDDDNAVAALRSLVLRRPSP